MEPPHIHSELALLRERGRGAVLDIASMRMLHLCVVCLSLGILRRPVPARAPQPYFGDSGVSLRAEHGSALVDRLALTPPMGWDSWKGFHFFTTEADVMAAAEGLATNGMRELGYRLVSIDGGWWGGGWSGQVRRNSSGFFTVNESKFPSGMPALSKYITSRGLGFGAYTAANDVMCSKDVGGSMNHEAQDVALFVNDWNVSAVKLDDCGARNASQLITRWHQLLNESGKHVLLFNSQVGCCPSGGGACSQNYSSSLPDFCYSQPGTMYQPSDGDDIWPVIIERHASIKGRGHLARPGHWLDPGYLTLDMGALYYDFTQTSLDLNQAVMALWAVVSAPLVTAVSFSGRYCPAGAFGNGTAWLPPDGCVASRPAPDAILDILRNEKAIAVDQLWAGFAGDVYPAEMVQHVLEIVPSTDADTTTDSAAPSVDSSLRLDKCDPTKQSQLWEINTTAGLTTVRSILEPVGPHGAAGCWDVNGCSTKPGASVTTGHCKPLPTPRSFAGCQAGTGPPNLCGCSGAWRLNATSTTATTVVFTSAMDGACLHTTGSGNIAVGTCSSKTEFTLTPVSGEARHSFRVSTPDGDMCVDSRTAPSPSPPPPPLSPMPELWGKPLPFGAAFVIFRNEAQSQVAELHVRFLLRHLPNSLNFNASAANSCVLDDIWGGESARVGVDTPVNVTLRRRQTFFFTVSNCSA